MKCLTFSNRNGSIHGALHNALGGYLISFSRRGGDSTRNVHVFSSVFPTYALACEFLRESVPDVRVSAPRVIQNSFT